MNTRLGEMDNGKISRRRDAKACGSGFATGTKVVLLQLPGVGHSPYKSAGTPLDTTRLAWDFVKQFARCDFNKYWLFQIHLPK